MKSIHIVDSELMQVASGNLPFDDIFLKLLLRDSCFYPSSGLDTSPIKFFDSIQSFVFCDFSIRRRNIESLVKKEFFGFNKIHSRFLDLDDIGLSGRVDSIGDSSGWNNNLLENIKKNVEGYTHWSLWEIDSRIVSLLFISWEAVDCYGKIYIKNKSIPCVISIIQPGHTMGGNWTNFFDPRSYFLKKVRAAGYPPYMLLGCASGPSYQYQIEIDRQNYLCDDCEWMTISNFSMTSHKNVILVRKDNRSRQQKISDENIAEKRRRDLALKREISFNNWIKIYEICREKRIKPPSCGFGLTHSEEIIRQKIDLKIELRDMKFKISNAERRNDAMALVALKSRLQKIQTVQHL